MNTKEEMGLEVMDAIHKVAFWLYERYGQDRVLEFGDLLDTPQAYCEPCELISPYVDDACLVCGTPHAPEEVRENIRPEIS